MLMIIAFMKFLIILYIYIENFVNLNCSIFYKTLVKIIYFILFIYFVMNCIYVYIHIYMY